MAKGVIDDLLTANERYADGFDMGDLTAQPRKRVAVVTCMDARIRVHAMLGLEEGDAHVIRNAGGVVTQDTIRSLAISQHMLGTTSVMIVQHTRCGLLGFDEEAFRKRVDRELSWDPGGFTDLDVSVRESIATICSSDYLPARDDIRGFVYDVETGRLREVEQQTQ
jgi:carbonic anhydrase